MVFKEISLTQPDGYCSTDFTEVNDQILKFPGSEFLQRYFRPIFTVCLSTAPLNWQPLSCFSFPRLWKGHLPWDKHWPLCSTRQEVYQRQKQTDEGLGRSCRMAIGKEKQRRAGCREAHGLPFAFMLGRANCPLGAGFSESNYETVPGSLRDTSSLTLGQTRRFWKVTGIPRNLPRTLPELDSSLRSWSALNKTRRDKGENKTAHF